MRTKEPARRASTKCTVQCRECTIFIGEGYQETVPIPAPDGKGLVCWRCYESLLRIAAKRTRSAT